MKHIKEGDWVFCPGDTLPVRVERKEQQYISDVGQRTIYWVNLGGLRMSYQRDDLTFADKGADA